MSILEIGMQGNFGDSTAKIVGKVVLSDEDGVVLNQWFLKSDGEEEEFFWIREYEDENETCYEILSVIEAEEGDTELDIASEIFADWRNFKYFAMRNGLKIESISGEVTQGPKEGEALKIADISFTDENDEEELDLEEDEVLVDTSIMWTEDETWVYGIEYLEESKIKAIFKL